MSAENPFSKKTSNNEQRRTLREEEELTSAPQLNEKFYEESARRDNNFRSLFDKLLGRNTVSGIDEAHEAGLVMNRASDLRSGRTGVTQQQAMESIDNKYTPYGEEAAEEYFKEHSDIKRAIEEGDYEMAQRLVDKGRGLPSHLTYFSNDLNEILLEEIAKKEGKK